MTYIFRRKVFPVEIFSVGLFRRVLFIRSPRELLLCFLHPKRVKIAEPDEESEPLLSSSMSKSSEDPFYAVRDNVSTQVERVKIKNEKFKSLMKKVDTSTDADFKELRKSAFLN